MNIKARTYLNGTQCKLTNRRVQVINLNEQELIIEFKTLCDEQSAKVPSAIHKVENGVIKSTGIKISVEAAIALHYALGKQLAEYSLTNDK